MMESNTFFSHRLRQIDFHGSVNAYIEAGKADDALLGIVGNLPAFSIHIQSACRAHGHAGGAARASFHKVIGLLREGFDAESQHLQRI